ncbi:hypothetical protein ACFLWO_03070 [Chloroflexota bacterium]
MRRWEYPFFVGFQGQGVPTPDGRGRPGIDVRPQWQGHIGGCVL